MEMADNQDSNQEIVSPAAEIQQDLPQETQEQASSPSEETDWIKNLRKGHKDALRRAEQAEREREILMNLVKQQPALNSQPAPVEEDILQELSREEYVPGEKVAKAYNKLKQDFRKEIDEVKKNYAQQQQQSLLNDLKREYPDFDQVVNSETLNLIETTNPKLATAMSKSGDPYSIMVQSYEYIKAKGLAEQSQPSRRAQETEKKIEQNKKTVQSPQAFDKRPIAAAFKMTDSMKKELQQEMYHYAQQAGMGY
jgi:hypothetical protein